MMKKIVLTAITALASLSADAQTLQWAAGIGGTGNDFALDITADAAGNVISVGGFDGTIDCDPGAGTFNLTSASAGFTDIYISKLDAAGNFLWAKQIGGTGTDYGYTLTADAAGNIIVSGNFSGTVDFDPGPGVHNLTAISGDTYILKLDAAGNFLWVDQLVGAGSGLNTNTGWGTATDAAGNIYITGQYTGTIDLDPGAGVSSHTIASGSGAIFLLKLDAAGALVWADGGMDCMYSTYAVGLSVDATGNVYISGQFNGTLDCDPGAGVVTLTGAGGSDGFVCKFDNAGALTWAKNIGGVSNEVCQEVLADAAGNVYTTGAFQGTSDFDPGAATFDLTSEGNKDVFVLKLDAAGNFVWASAMGGTSYDLPSGMGLDAAGNIYTSGSFGGSSDYDPGAGVATLTSVGPDDIFISKLDNNGNYVWAVRLGGSSSEGTNGMFIDAAGTIYIAGDFKTIPDFDPGAGTSTLTSAGGTDAFIAKYTETITGIEINTALQTALAYPNPFSASTVIEIANADAKTMELVLFNAAGQKVQHLQNLNGTSILIERADLAKGLYFYNVIGNGEVIAKGKLIAE